MAKVLMVRCTTVFPITPVSFIVFKEGEERDGGGREGERERGREGGEERGREGEGEGRVGNENRKAQKRNENAPQEGRKWKE